MFTIRRITRLALLVVTMVLAAMPVAAGGIRVENVVFFAPRESPDVMRATFDISWENAWRNDRNHDAAWVFLKLQREDGSYIHIRVAPEGHRIIQLPGRPRIEGEIAHVDGGTGIFVRPSERHRRDVAWRVSVDFHPDDIDEALVTGVIRVFAIEMVYVPEGPFEIGDSDATSVGFGSYYEAGPGGTPRARFRVDSERAVAVGPEEGRLHYVAAEYVGDAQGPVPAAFPKGYTAFYVMKYELSQGQYVAFLNSLAAGVVAERVNFLDETYYDKRGTISFEDDAYVARRPERPMNFITWDDGLAFTDWAGLRPMTDFEFTKAARGPESPGPGAFPWGTSSRDALARFVGPDDDLILAGGWTEDQLTDETREVFGASYYWVMDLAGSVWERVITAGQSDGRRFEGSHGDGILSEAARATNEDWPHTWAEQEGHGYRGGGFYDQGRASHEFNPYSPVSYRPFGAWSGADPHRAYGYRAARTAR